MKNEKTVRYQEIGDVQYRRNSRAKNIAIRINAEGMIRVTVPGRCSFQRAEQFVLDKRSWINQKTLKIKRLKEENLAWDVGDLIHLGEARILFFQGKQPEYTINEKDRIYEIMLPYGFDPEDVIQQAELKEWVAIIGYKEAKRQLPGILKEIADAYSLPYQKLTVRRMHTRWGSCSSKNNISLSSGLIFLPEHLVRYICLHELVHTIHKDHSNRFWNALLQLDPGALQHRKELRNMTIIA